MCGELVGIVLLCVGSMHIGGGVDVVGDAGVEYGCATGAAGGEWCEESDCVIDGSDVEG